MVSVEVEAIAFTTIAAILSLAAFSGIAFGGAKGAFMGKANWFTFIIFMIMLGGIAYAPYLVYTEYKKARTENSP